MADLTPQQAIANVLHHVEDEGLNDPDAMYLADDVLHALTVAGYAVVATADLRVALTFAMNLTALSEVEPEEMQALGRIAVALTDPAAWMARRPMAEISRDSTRRIIVDWIDEFLDEQVGDQAFIQGAEWPPIVADLFAALRTDLVELRNLIREATP